MVRVLPIHFGVVFLVAKICKGGGGKKQFFGAPNSFFRVWAPETGGSTGNCLAKGSRGQVTYSESGWSLAEAADIGLGDHARVGIFLGPHHVCPGHGSSAVHNLSLGKYW